MSQITAFILGSGGAGPILTLTGNSGGAVPPTAGNINILGSGILTVTGNPGTSTLTISATNPIPIGNGGTNATSFATTDGTVYYDGTRLVTTATGTAGQVLTSNGAGVAPTYQAAAGGGITSIAGDTGGAQSGPAITLTGLTTAGSTVSFAGAANAITLHVTTAAPNTIMGGSAGNNSLTANSCTGFGFSVLNALTSGNFNTAFGHGGLLHNTSGSANSAYGYTSIISNVTGIGNSGFGMQSLVQLGLNNGAGGSYNCAFGYQAGLNYVNSESSNIMINNSGTAAESNVLRIGAGTGTGNQQLNSAFISGIFGKTVGVSGVPVVVDNTDNLGTVVSSQRYKDNIEDMDDYSEDIYDLRPVKFNYKNHREEDISVGLIAEEVEEEMPQLVVKDLEGNPETVKYLDLIPMLLNELQKLRKEFVDLQEQLEDLEDKLPIRKKKE